MGKSTTCRGNNFSQTYHRQEINSPDSDMLVDRVDEFIAKHPHWVVYIRGNRKFKCTHCYQEEEGSPDPRCTLCFGLGYSFKAHRLKTRVWDLTQGAIAESELSKPMGILNSGEMAFAMQRGYYPSNGDLILEVEWDTPTADIELKGKPVKVFAAWTVSQTITRSFRGRAAFHVASCSSYVGDLGWFDSFLLNSGNIYSVV